MMAAQTKRLDKSVAQLGDLTMSQVQYRSEISEPSNTLATR